MKEKFDHISGKISKAITHHYSTSFSMGIRLLHPSIRNDIYNIYGFVRLADEIVDSFHGFDKEQMLADLRAQTATAIANKISINPVLNSFQQTVNRYSISQELIEHFLQSMEMDLQPEVYNRSKYDLYIYGSAEAVGLMCLHVFCKGDCKDFETLKPYAQKLGSAFQKVNFLRDIQADKELLGREYFPGLSKSKLDHISKRQIETEVEEEFMEAYEGIKKLPDCCRQGVFIAYSYYLELLKKIKRTHPEELHLRRVRVSNLQKMRILLVHKIMRAI